MRDTLRSEIIHILITEWEATEDQAVNMIRDEAIYNGFAESRRKWRFLMALGKVDQFTPSFPRVRPGEAEMFASDEAVKHWLRRQTQDVKTSTKRRIRRTGHSGRARQCRQFAHAASV